MWLKTPRGYLNLDHVVTIDALENSVVFYGSNAEGTHIIHERIKCRTPELADQLLAALEGKLQPLIVSIPD